MKKFTRFITMALAVSLCSYAYSQSISFYPANTFPIGSNPVQTVTKDINGDGKADLLTITSGSNLLSIFMNTTAAGATTATYAARQDIALTYSPMALIVQDFDGDGKPDVVVSFGNGPGSVSGFTNNTTPGSFTATFGPRVDFAFSLNIKSFAVGDFNNDGRPDIAGVNPAYNYITILYNSPTSGTTGWYLNNGGWTVAVPSNPISVAVADINNDGKDDIIAACGANMVSTLMNYTAQGTYTISFNAHQDMTVPGARFVNLVTGDMNNDGKKDLILSNNPAGSCAIILNNTTYNASVITYKDAQQFACGSNPINVSLFDINKDGRLDIVSTLTGAPSNLISILPNTTPAGSFTVTFNARQDFTTDVYPLTLSISDFNGDGKPDLAVGTNSGLIDVMLNATITGAPAVSFAPHADIAAVSPIMVTHGDLNNDGRPDIITVNGISNTVSIYINTTAPGGTVPSYGPKQDIPGFNNPVIVTVNDFNMDGKEDILVISKNNGYLTMLNNTTMAGSGSFTYNFQNFASIPYAYAVAVGDINQDGKPDMVMTASDGGLYTFINLTTPGSGAVNFTYGGSGAGGLCYSVALADLNGDGKLDVLTASYTANTVNTFLNSTAQGYSGYSYYGMQSFPVSNFPHSITAADINGDGRPDIVTCNDNTLTVFLNAGPLGASYISLGPRTEFPVGSGIATNTLLASEINGDGLVDLAFANKLANKVSVFQNTTVLGSASPGFAAPQDFSAGPNPVSLISGDVNQDNRPDLFTVNSGNNTISVLINTANANLPLTFTSFAGKRNGNAVLLQWSTVNESNNKGYGIEKSIDGRNWQNIGFVTAGIPGTAVFRYSFTDNTPSAGLNYYRLRQEDLDGKTTYSKVVSISFDQVTDFHLYSNYPNPFASITTIRYSIPVATVVTIKVYTAAGEEVAILQNGQKVKGEYSYTWNTSRLDNGIYFVKMVAGNYTGSIRIIKSN